MDHERGLSWRTKIMPRRSPHFLHAQGQTSVEAPSVQPNVNYNSLASSLEGNVHKMLQKTHSLMDQGATALSPLQQRRYRRFGEHHVQKLQLRHVDTSRVHVLMRVASQVTWGAYSLSLVFREKRASMNVLFIFALLQSTLCI